MDIFDYIDAFYSRTRRHSYLKGVLALTSLSELLVATVNNGLYDWESFMFCQATNLLLDRKSSGVI